MQELYKKQNKQDNKLKDNKKLMKNLKDKELD